MAKIWLFRDGSPTNIGGPLGERPLPWCQDKLKVSKTNFLCGLNTTPRFGEPDNHGAPFRAYRYVAVEVTEKDAPLNGFDCGFYRAGVTPQEAEEALVT